MQVKEKDLRIFIFHFIVTVQSQKLLQGSTISNNLGYKKYKAK